MEKQPDSKSVLRAPAEHLKEQKHQDPLNHYKICVPNHNQEGKPQIKYRGAHILLVTDTSP